MHTYGVFSTFLCVNLVSILHMYSFAVNTNGVFNILSKMYNGIFRKLINSFESLTVVTTIQHRFLIES